MKKELKTATLTLKLEPELKDQIEAQARQLDMSTSAFMRLCHRAWEEKRDNYFLSNKNEVTK